MERLRVACLCLATGLALLSGNASAGNTSTNTSTNTSSDWWSSNSSSNSSDNSSSDSAPAPWYDYSGASDEGAYDLRYDLRRDEREYDGIIFGCEEIYIYEDFD